jgi:hypothetical protein
VRNTRNGGGRRAKNYVYQDKGSDVESDAFSNGSQEEEFIDSDPLTDEEDFSAEEFGAKRTGTTARRRGVEQKKKTIRPRFEGTSRTRRSRNR